MVYPVSLVSLVVNLTPPVTGALGKLCLLSGDIVYPVIDLPPSDNGTIIMSIAVSSPELSYFVLFPAQTIEGIAYLEAASETFNLNSNVMVNVTLYPVVGPTPPLPNIGVLVAVAAGLYLLTKK